MPQKLQPVAIGAVLLAAALLFYSQTSAFAWDEGFHLLAAQLIRNGKRPYLDFFFPQTPLNAYWNALWMLLFGDTWRIAHLAAALSTATGAYVLAQYVQSRLGTAMALCSLAAFGFNELIFRFGAIGQAYGFCLLMLICAFRCSVIARERHGSTWAAAAGLFSGAAAAGSLLTAPAVPVFLLWLAFYTRSFRVVAAFAGAAFIPFLSVIIPAMDAQSVVFFQIFDYNARYRAVLWTGNAALANNFNVYKSFFQSPSALALASLSFIALPKLRRQPDVLLCAAQTVVLALYIGSPSPTFSRYFVFVVPFLVLMALAGLQQVPQNRRRTGAAVLVAIVVFSLARTLYRERDSYGWQQMETIARKVNEVTAPGAPILADEQIYFLARRMPPSGMEHENSHKPLPLTREFRAALHIVSRTELDRATQAHQFATVATCADEDSIEKSGLPKIYRHSADVGECTVFW